MQRQGDPIPDERPLTSQERELTRWMLEHGKPESQAFLSQPDLARVASRCPCGCASIDFEVEGFPKPSGGLSILGDYVFGGELDLSGAFVFERNGVLAGVEVYGLAGDAPKVLPEPESLRPFSGPAGEPPHVSPRETSP
jgi:hypothetical protein